MLLFTIWPLLVVLSFVKRVLGSASRTTVIEPLAGPLGLVAAGPVAAAGLAAGWATGAAGLTAGLPAGAAAGAAAGALVAAGGAAGAQASRRVVRTVNEMAAVDTRHPGRRGGEDGTLVVML